MKTDNKWLYVGGIGVLAVLVVIGVVWSGEENASSPADAGAGSDEERDGGESESDTGSEGDASASEEEDGGPTEESGDGGEAAPAEGEEDAGAVAEPVPEDPTECRAYCQRLAERGALAEGMDSSACVEQLCGLTEEQEDGGIEAPAVSTISEPDVPELPDECRAQCQALHERGDLRDGMSLDECYTQLCSTESEEGDAGAEESE